MKKCNLEDFVHALQVLDEKLGAVGQKIEIRAIGGFAMMYYGFRDNGYTIDIDSLTESFSDDVRYLISETAVELNIDEDWLNTDCSTLEGFLGDLSEKIKWITSSYKFDNIELKVADITGLIRSKSKAIQDGGLVPRSTDKKDLLAGLSKIGINNIDQLNASEEYSFIRDEYARCYDFLLSEQSW